MPVLAFNPTPESSLHMSATILAVDLLLLAAAIALAIFVMATERKWNFHRIWALALKRQLLSRFYIEVTLAAIACAVAAQLLALREWPAAKRKRAP